MKANQSKKWVFWQICKCGNRKLGTGKSLTPIPDRYHNDCPKCRKADPIAEAKERAYQQEYFRYL